MTSDPTRRERESALIAFYAVEMAERSTRRLDERRISVRQEFISQLGAESRSAVVEVGCGTGQDGVALAAAGLDYCGVDLSPVGVRHCEQAGPPWSATPHSFRCARVARTRPGA